MKWTRMLSSVVMAVATTTPVHAQLPPKNIIGTDTTDSAAERTIRADVVVVGKVTAVEEKTRDFKATPQAAKATSFKIVMLEVEEILKGAADRKTISVAYPMDGSSIPKDLEGLFFLVQIGQEGVYRAASYNDILPKNYLSFTRELDEARVTAKVFTDPIAALKDPQRDKRVFAAYLLIRHYRTQAQGVPTRLEPIDAEESKLILSALALADWERAPHYAHKAFDALPLTVQDGWYREKVRAAAENSPTAVTDAMQQWLANNAATYRIQRIAVVK